DTAINVCIAGESGVYNNERTALIVNSRATRRAVVIVEHAALDRYVAAVIVDCAKVESVEVHVDDREEAHTSVSAVDTVGQRQILKGELAVLPYLEHARHRGIMVGGECQDVSTRTLNRHPTGNEYGTVQYDPAC